MTLIFHEDAYYNLKHATEIKMTSVKVEIWFLDESKVTITNPKQIKKIADWIQQQEVL